MANGLIAYEARHRMVVDESFVAIAGAVNFQPVRLTLSINGSEAETVETLSDGSFFSVVSLAVGFNEITITAEGSAGATVQTIIPVIRLVTDRKQSDLSALLSLLKKPVDQWAEQERAAFYAGLYQGGYSAVDLNRVVLTLQTFVSALRKAGYFAPQNTRKNWSFEDRLLPSEAETYLADIESVRNALPLFSETPATPKTMEKLGWKEANDIEKILILADAMLAKRSSWYSGEIYSGEV